MIELHFVKEGNVLTKDATSTQKLMWNMGVVMAQSYTDQLSNNVKRSMRFKVQNGECCGRAPIGYLNAKDPLTNKATVVIDSRVGDLVRQLFERYSKGKTSVSELRRYADDIGLRTRAGNKLCLQQVHNIIQNSFYCGVMRVKGHTHPHQYETIISKALFDKCQEIRLNKGYRKAEERSQRQFLFEGLLRCHASNRLVTYDLKKKQYVYLICRDSNDLSKKLWINKNLVLKQFEEALQTVSITDDNRDLVIEHIKKSCADDQDTLLNNQRSMKRQQHDNQVKLDRLTELLIDGDIDSQTYERASPQLHLNNDEIRLSLQERCITLKDIEKSLVNFVTILKSLISLIKSSKIELQRTMIKSPFSNCLLDASNVRFDWVSVMLIVAKNRRNPHFFIMNLII